MSDFEKDLSVVAAIEAVPRILEVVCQITGMGFSAVARVTEQRWICLASRDEINFGLKPGGELKVETTLCDEIHDSKEAIVIDDVDSDTIYCSHPTPAMYGFKSYISVPIILSNGSFYGTLCAIDPTPRHLKSSPTLTIFKLFADLIGQHLESADRLSNTVSELAEERSAGVLREQFVAILGHDLRNPVASLIAGTSILQRKHTDDFSKNIYGQMQTSLKRMTLLINDVLDFATGRLGGGLTTRLSTDEPLKPILEEVLSEARMIAPNRIIEAKLEFSDPIPSDTMRLRQLFTNLVSNAIAYGEPSQPILVTATGNGFFELSVANKGEPIPPAAMENLFRPYTRGKKREIQKGLGLGLYIASEIARAHKGTLTAVSTDDETKFTFRMPLD